MVTILLPKFMKGPIQVELTHELVITFKQKILNYAKSNLMAIYNGYIVNRLGKQTDMSIYAHGVDTKYFHDVFKHKKPNVLLQNLHLLSLIH